MMQIMPVSELRNHYAAVEEAVATGGPVFLTKNGYGSILMKTDLVHTTHSNGHTHTHRTYWSMRGIQEPAECYRLLTGILQINDEYRFIR